MFPTSSALNFSSSKHLAECHRETQTSSSTVKDSSTLSQLSTADKGTITVFEFNELLQDPQKPSDITIIKDVFSEEIHDHDSDSESEEAKSNRYTYCREVIKPYLKDYPLDCPISDEQLIRDALIAAHQDFPDYQPCFEIYDGDKDKADKKDNTDKSGNIDKISSVLSTDNKPESTKAHADKKPKKSKSSQTSILDKEISSTECGKKSYKCKSRREKEKISDPDTSIKGPIKVYRKKTKSLSNSTDSSKNSLKSKMSEDKANKQDPSSTSDDDACPPKPRDPRCPTKKTRPSTADEVNQGGRKSPLGPPSACKNRTTEGLSTCKNTPSVGSCKNESDAEGSPSKKKKDENPCPYRMEMSDSVSKHSLIHNTDKPKSMSEAHSETIGTMKTAVEDFFGKVYQTTRDAVTLIKTESAKQTDNFAKPPQSFSDDRDSKNIETDNFKFFRMPEKNDFGSRDTKDDNSGHGLSKTAEMVVGKILNKVDSTISMLSSHVDLEKVTSLIKVKNEASSRFGGTQDEAAASNTKMSVGNSMFTAIKSKIMSMFSESEMQRVIPRKSNESTNSDEENAYNSIGRF